MLLSFIAFFTVLYVLGIGQRVELMLLIGGVIHFFFMYLAIQKHYEMYPEEIGNYMSGVARGMEASVIGIVGFTVFIAIFLVIDATLLTRLRENAHMAAYLTPVTVSLSIVAIGLMSSLIGSYILTRILDISIKKQDV
jgi:hypothetical protein